MRRAPHPLVLAALALSLDLSLSLDLITAPAFAERNLVPTLDRNFDFCPGRPAKPVWTQEISLRQVYQRVLAQDIYRARKLERVVEASSCDCEIRFPSWDAAEAAFRECYANAERWELLEASGGYNRRANGVRLEAKAICKAAGNW